MIRVLARLVLLMALVASVQAHATSELRLGATVAGPATATVAVPLIYTAAPSDTATLHFDLSFDSSQLTPTKAEKGVGAGAHDIDVALIGNGGTARVVVIPSPTNSPIPSGTLGYIHFSVPTGYVTENQSLILANVQGLTALGEVRSTFSVLSGLIADARDTTSDQDDDGITDVYESANGLHPLDGTDALADTDNDGLTNVAEFQLGTNLNAGDTDDDGLPDAFEAGQTGVSATVADGAADFDGDGLTNLAEYALGTLLDSIDTDGDGMSDGFEASHAGLNAKSAGDALLDFDGDGLTNLKEAQLGIDPNNKDTDGDGIADNVEVSIAGLNPADGSDAAADFDGDGLTNLVELNIGTDLNVSNGKPLLSGVGLSGQLSQNTVLLPHGVYYVPSGVEVPAGITLTMAPGSTLLFGPSVGLTVNGVLDVRGDAVSKVGFVREGTMLGTGGWLGITVNAGGVAHLSYAWIRGASKGVYFNGGSGDVKHSRVDTNVFGIYVYGKSDPTISDGNVITGNTYGIYVYGLNQAGMNPNPVITGNSIYGNISYNLYTYAFYDPLNTVVNAANNWWGTADVPALIATIYDSLDTGGAPVVEFLPYLDAEGGNPTRVGAIRGTLVANTSIGSGTTEVLNDVIVPAGLTVTVEAGAKLRFYASKKLQVSGVLDVRGSAAGPVTFTTVNATVAKGKWVGIEVAPGGRVLVDHAVIEGADKGINFTDAGGEVRNTLIRTNNYGIYLSGPANPQIGGGNTITANTYGVYVVGTSQAGKNPAPIISGNSLYNNSSYNLYTKTFYNAANSLVAATNNWWGTTDVPTIIAKIYDNLDASTAPVAEFLPYLDSEWGTPTSVGAIRGTVTSDTVLSNGTTEVLSDLTVTAGTLLTLDPGAKLRFYGSGKVLKVNGTLEVRGTAVSPVTFTTSNSTVAKGRWAGIEVPAGGRVLIDNAVIEGADKGIKFTDAGGEIRNTLIRTNNYGIYVSGASNPQIGGGNTVTGNSYGIWVAGTSQAGMNPAPVISGNSLYGNSSYNLYTKTFYNAANSLVTATSNWWGTTDVPTIIAKIYDNLDASTAPVAEFLPYLDSEWGIPTSVGAIRGTVTSDTVLSNGTTEVLSDLTVAAGTTLTLDPGARLRFYGSGKVFKVNGNLVVRGSAANRVTFTSNQTTVSKGSWKGIEVGAGGQVAIDYALIEGADKGLSFVDAGGTVQNSIIRTNNYGIYVYGASSPRIGGGNLITANTYGVYVLGLSQAGKNPNPVVTGNSLYGNTSYDFYSRAFYSASSVTLDVTNNWWGSTDIPALLTKIYDNMDTSTAPTADFVPMLDSENGSSTNANVLEGEWRGQFALISGQRYHVLRSLTVPYGEVFSVPAGTTIQFYRPESELRIDGSLMVLGTADAPARLTSGKTTPTVGSWSGVVIGRTAVDVMVTGALIDWADVGMKFDNAGGTVRASTLRNNDTAFYIVGDANPLITDRNLVTANYIGFDVFGTRQSGLDPYPVVMGNNIHGNTQYDYYAHWFYNPAYSYLNASNNWWGSQDRAQIAVKVYDYADNTTSSPQVTIEPVAPAALQ